MAKIDNMMGPTTRLSTNLTTARQTPKVDFGARLQSGLTNAAGAVGTGVGAVAGMIPGGQIVSAAVSSMHTFSSTSGSGMAGAPYAGVMGTAVAPMGGGVGGMVSASTGISVGGGLGGVGTPTVGAGANASPTDTVNGNFSLNKMAEENSKLLNLQAAIQQESQTFTAISNTMKARHDSIKNSISNVR